MKIEEKKKKKERKKNCNQSRALGLEERRGVFFTWIWVKVIKFLHSFRKTKTKLAREREGDFPPIASEPR
jgi:hypothetical protein